MTDKANKFPSTAFNQKGHPNADINGEYVPCPINQPFHYQDRTAHDLGQLEHPVRPGYCEKHLRLGCESPECR